MVRIFKAIRKILTATGKYMESYVRDDKPQSSGRVISVTLCIAGLIVAYFQPDNYAMVGIFIGAATGNKIGGRFAEKRRRRY